MVSREMGRLKEGRESTADQSQSFAADHCRPRIFAADSTCCTKTERQIIIIASSWQI
jgi:hypothetical protein